jgi:outer membrane receptor protein involved in Fe transport
MKTLAAPRPAIPLADRAHPARQHLWLLAFALLTQGAWAQQAATSLPTKAPGEEVVELSPFVVADKADQGYVASNTLAGSRLNTSLKDVASPLEVFTKDFLDDIAATSVADAMRYHSNAQEDLGDENSAMQQDYKAQAQVPNRFTVRGQAQTLARDYFNFNIPQDLFSTGRVDASRGPNAILFGIGNAGGVTNTTSKTANFWKDATSVSGQVDNDGGTRFTLDHNEVVNPKLAYRVNLLQQNRESWQVYGRDDRFGAQLAATWRVGQNTRLRTDAEYGTLGDYASRTYPVITNADKWDIGGRPTYDPSVIRTTAQINAQPSSLLTMPHAVTGVPVSNRLLTATANDIADRFYWIDNGGGTFFSTGNRYDLTALGQRMLSQDEIYGTMINGPGAKRDLEYKTFSAFLEHQFSRSFQVELAANWWKHDWYAVAFGNEASLQGDASTLFYRNAPASAIVSGASTVTSLANPNSGQYYYEDIPRPDLRASENLNLRLTASYELDTRRFGRHRFAAMLARSTSDKEVEIREARVLTDGRGNRLTSPDDAAYAIYTRHYVTNESDPAQYRNADPRTLPGRVTDPFTGRTFETGYVALPGVTNRSEDQIDTGLLSMQNYWFKDRLVTTVGYRRDQSKVRSFGTDEIGADGLPTGRYYRDPVTYQVRVNPADVDRDVSKTSSTMTLGAVYHLTDKLSLTYNRSTNAGPPFGGWSAPNVAEPIDVSTQRGTRDNEPYPPSGKGEDYGIKLTLLRGRLYVNANYFTTEGTGTLTWTDSGYDNRFAEIISGLAGQQVFRNTAELAQIPTGSVGLLQLDSQGKIIESGGTPVYQVIPNLIPLGMPRPDFRAKDDDYRSTGYELNLTANITRNLSVRAGYSYTEREIFNTWGMAQDFSAKVREWIASGRDFDASLLARLPIRRVTALSDAQAGSSFIRDSAGRYYLSALDVLDYDIDQGLAIEQENAKQGFGQRHHKGNLWASYKFTEGKLRGLSVFGGLRYQSGAEVGYRLYFDENGVAQRDRSSIATSDPMFFNDAGLAYVTGAGWLKRGATLRLQYNVRNIFNDNDYAVARTATDTYGNLLTTRYYVPEPRAMSFSATVSF